MFRAAHRGAISDRLPLILGHPALLARHEHNRMAHRPKATISRITPVLLRGLRRGGRLERDHDDHGWLLEFRQVGRGVAPSNPSSESALRTLQSAPLRRGGHASAPRVQGNRLPTAARSGRPAAAFHDTLPAHPWLASSPRPIATSGHLGGERMLRRSPARQSSPGSGRQRPLPRAPPTMTASRPS